MGALLVAMLDGAGFGMTGLSHTANSRIGCRVPCVAALNVAPMLRRTGACGAHRLFFQTVVSPSDLGVAVCGRKDAAAIKFACLRTSRRGTAAALIFSDASGMVDPVTAGAGIGADANTVWLASPLARVAAK